MCMILFVYLFMDVYMSSLLRTQHLATQLDHSTAQHDQTKPQARQHGLAR